MSFEEVAGQKHPRRQTLPPLCSRPYTQTDHGVKSPRANEHVPRIAKWHMDATFCTRSAPPSSRLVSPRAAASIRKRWRAKSAKRSTVSGLSSSAIPRGIQDVVVRYRHQDIEFFGLLC